MGDDRKSKTTIWGGHSDGRGITSRVRAPNHQPRTDLLKLNNRQQAASESSNNPAAESQPKQRPGSPACGVHECVSVNRYSTSNFKTCWSLRRNRVNPHLRPTPFDQFECLTGRRLPVSAARQVATRSLFHSRAAVSGTSPRRLS